MPKTSIVLINKQIDAEVVLINNLRPLFIVLYLPYFVASFSIILLHIWNESLILLALMVIG